MVEPTPRWQTRLAQSTRYRFDIPPMPRLGEHRARFGDVQRLDHPSVVALGPARRRGDQPLGRRHLRLARREAAVDGLELARMNRRFAVEAVAAALRAFLREFPVGLQT